MSLHRLAYPSRCTICNIGRYIVPPCYKCVVHGLMCTGCSSNPAGCPICKRQPVREKEADKLLNIHIALPCVNEPDCNLAFPSFWYDEHLIECSLKQTNEVLPIAPVIYIPLEPNQNPALAFPRQLQFERALRIAANKTARRRRNRQRRKAGTTIRPAPSPFTGKYRPG